MSVEIWRIEHLLGWLAEGGVRVLGILLMAGLAIRTVRYLTRRFERLVDDGDPRTLTAREQRARTLSAVANSAAAVVISVIAGMMVLQELGFNIGPIIAGAGIAGVALGFGAQSLVKDVIAGFFLLLEDQFAVGDVIRVGGVSGLVERLNLRTTVLRDIDGSVHIVPNGQISIVSNLTKEWSRALLHIGVSYQEDVDRVLAVLAEVSRDLQHDSTYGPLLLEPPEIPGVEGLDDSQVTIRIMAKTVPLRQWDVMRELRRRIKARFDEEGIEIPYPQRTVWVRGEKV